MMKDDQNICISLHFVEREQEWGRHIYRERRNIVHIT